MQAKGKGRITKAAVQELLEETEHYFFSLLTTLKIFWNTDIKSIRSTLQNLKYGRLFN
jgi:hypothetical protein